MTCCPIAANVVQAEVSGEVGIGLGKITLLAAPPVAEFRQLSFPYPGDATDVFTLITDQGTGILDQSTGALLRWADLTTGERVTETVYMLHTGQGASLLGLLMRLMALGVPVMGATGLIMWLAGRRARPRIKANIAAARAETILLVGSEGRSTWGFAATLHRALTAAGQTVHAVLMSAFDPAKFAQAQRFVILAATYGDGDAPISAKGFLERLLRLAAAPAAQVAVLGFGDRSYPAYCAFAESVAAHARAKGWSILMPFETVAHQSPQDFAR